MSTMHPKNAMILRKHVGEAEGPDGAKFEMSLANGYIPCVKDMKTGKTFALGWDDIVAQAVAAGVSKESITYAKIIDAASGEFLGYDNTGVDDWQAHFAKCWSKHWKGRSVRFEVVTQEEYEAASEKSCG